MALLNPNIATNYEAIGPLAGIMADQKYNDWQTQQGLENQRGGIENASAQHTLDQAMLDDPVKAAQRSANIATAGITTNTAGAATDAKFAQLLADKSTGELKQADNKAEWMATQAPWINSQDPQNFDNSPAARARWQTFKDDASKVGIKFQNDEWSPQAAQEALMKSQGSAEYRKYRQQSAMEAAKTASAEKIAAGHDTATITAAAMGADKAQNLALLALSPAKRAQAIVGAKPIINGADLTAVIQATVQEEQNGDNAKQSRASAWATWNNTTEAARLKEAARLNMPPRSDGSAPSADEIATATQQQELRKTATEHVLNMFADKDYMDANGKITKLGSVSGKTAEKSAGEQSKAVNPNVRTASPTEQKQANMTPPELIGKFPRGSQYAIDPSNPAQWIIQKPDGSTITIQRSGPPAAQAPMAPPQQQQQPAPQPRVL